MLVASTLEVLEHLYFDRVHFFPLALGVLPSRMFDNAASALVKKKSGLSSVLVDLYLEMTMPTDGKLIVNLMKPR